MDDRRVAYAIFLSILVILVYTELVINPYNQTPQPAQQQASQSGPTESVPQPEWKPPVTTDTNSPEVVKTTSAAAVPELESYKKSPQVTVENGRFIATYSLLGGVLTSFQLKEYKANLDKPDLIEIIAPGNGGYPLGVFASGFSDSAVSYQVSSASTKPVAPLKYMVAPGKELTVTLAGRSEDGMEVVKAFNFTSNAFTFGVDVSVIKDGKAPPSVWLEWSEYIAADSKESRYNPKQYTLYSSDKDISRTPVTSLEEQWEESANTWASIGSNYFTAALIPYAPGVNTTIVKRGNTYFARVLGSGSEGKFKVYLGPKTHKDLRDAGFDLERSIDLGWFAFIGQPLLVGIELFYNLLGNYGLAIVLLTIILKTVLLPLTKTSFKSMAKMQDLQPEMKALRERVKDPQQQQQEMMALYKKHGVNPMGGCFPMLLQIPIFLGMYNALRSSIDLRHTPFALWINDLSAPEQLIVFGIPIPVMILLMGASMFLQQLTTPTSADPAQKKMMMMMPVVFTIMFVIFPFPAGLVLYWLVNNVISIIQQAALRTDRNISPLYATIAGGVGVFGVAFIVTLL